MHEKHLTQGDSKAISVDAVDISGMRAAEALIIDIDGFEGPLDLMLALARSQKIDLMQISVLSLVEQYLDFIEKARALRIELAADYLVMAAWLAFLKSKLLLPPEPEGPEPSGEEMAAHLAFQLERLDAMRQAAGQLMGLERLGEKRFARGAPEDVSRDVSVTWDASLADILRAYARVSAKVEFRPYAFDREGVFTMEQALERLRSLIGYSGDWLDLAAFLPDGWDGPDRRRSALAACFAASLELARQGRIEISQSGTFGPITLRHRDSSE